jgi:hypothetical protein
MGENGERLGRTTGYSRRGWLTGLAGVGAVAVALVMMLSPAAAATGGSLTLHAAYKGAVSPNSYLDVYGCAKAKITKPFHFALKTGIATAASNGKANQCKKVIAGVGVSSSAYSDGGVEVALPLKLPSGTTSVTVNTAQSAAVMVKATDGLTSNTVPPPVCSTAGETVSENITEYEWNNFASYNESIYELETGTYNYFYNYSYGSPVPSPFYLNNTTYYYHDYYHAITASCQASASFETEQYGYLIDETTGVEQFSNYTSSEFQDTYVEVDNTTDWGSSSYYYWDEGTTYGSNATTPFSYNSSGSLVETESDSSAGFVFHSTPGTNNTQTWSQTGSAINSMDFNNSFNTHNKYVLEIELYVYTSASDSWKRGYGEWALNMATSGNGYKLSSIVLS